jgi:hypothetical protein
MVSAPNVEFPGVAVRPEGGKSSMEVKVRAGRFQPYLGLTQRWFAAMIISVLTAMLTRVTVPSKAAKRRVFADTQSPRPALPL